MSLVTRGLTAGTLATRGLGAAADLTPDPLGPYGQLSRGGVSLGSWRDDPLVSKTTDRKRRAAIIAAALAYYWEY